MPAGSYDGDVDVEERAEYKGGGPDQHGRLVPGDMRACLHVMSLKAEDQPVQL
jgi:hypothetical protein